MRTEPLLRRAAWTNSIIQRLRLSLRSSSAQGMLRDRRLQFQAAPLETRSTPPLGAPAANAVPKRTAVWMNYESLINPQARCELSFSWGNHQGWHYVLHLGNTRYFAEIPTSVKLVSCKVSKAKLTHGSAMPKKLLSVQVTQIPKVQVVPEILFYKPSARCLHFISQTV